MKIDAFKSLFYNLKLRQKLLISYLLLIVIPLGVFIVYFNTKAMPEIESQMKYSAKQSFEQSCSFLSYKLEKIFDVSNTILANQQIGSILSQKTSTLDVYKQLGDKRDLSRLLRSYQNSDEIYHINLYIDDDLVYSTENVNLYSVKSISNFEWFQRMEAEKGKVLWLPPLPNENNVDDSDKGISAIRLIVDSNNFLNEIGALSVEIKESNLKNILSRASTTKNSITYIVNSRNEIITSSVPNISFKQVLDTQTLKSVTNSIDYFDTYNMPNEIVLLGCKYIPNTDWAAVTLIPYKELLQTGSRAVYNMLIVFFLVTTLAYALIFIQSFSVTSRIRLLTNSVRSYRKGNGVMPINIKANDEIGELITDFNYMMDRITSLIQEQVKLGLAIKNSELKALQSQINPHFLYNTLDLLNWTAINNKVPEIASIVKTLSKFYKLSLSKGEDVVSIGTELEHVKLYMDIQNKRYDNSFLFIVDVDNEILDCSIIKIIMQPIVENSIMHGIMPKKDGKGTIKISGQVKNDSIILTVEDDGVGISSEKARTLMLCVSKSTHGYGIKNINERVKLKYGIRYGLSYHSELGKGTKVDILLPLIRYQEE